MDEEPDRRIRRTRRALAEALIQLTSERPYATIQVRDITDRADVGYATFYRHYDSKDDLMLAVFDAVTSELEISTVAKDDSYFEQEGNRLFSHVRRYENLYRSILQSQGFVRKLRDLLAQRIKSHIQLHSEELIDLAFPIDLAANHMVVSLIGLIEWWLDQRLSLPVEEMARIYERLIVRATWYALSASNRLSMPGHTL
jgi:AcrR family transcriptional regulator